MSFIVVRQPLFLVAQASQIANLTAERDEANNKIAELKESKAKMEQYFEEPGFDPNLMSLMLKLRRLKLFRDELANAAKPLLDLLFADGAGSSSGDSSQLLDQLHYAPEKYQEKVLDTATIGSSQALGHGEVNIPRVDISLLAKHTQQELL